MDIHKAIVQAYKGQAKFPTNLMINHLLVCRMVYQKTRNTEVSLWYIDEDDKVLELEDDGAVGKPASMSSELDQDRKDAIAWIIALPTNDDAIPNWTET